MFSLKIRYTLYGMIISASLITIVAQATTTDGVFGEYFRRMVGTCNLSNAQVLTGFDDNPSVALFGTKACTTLTSLLDTIGIKVTSGNVGIGAVAAPTAKLQVVGMVKSSPTTIADSSDTLTTRSYVDAGLIDICNKIGGTWDVITNKCGTTTANACSTTLPTCNPTGCTLTYSPSSVNQSWVKGAGSCGFSCNANYSDATCSTYTAPTGNSCSTTLPTCNGAGTCTLTYSPTSVNQSWAQNAASCGFSCAANYSGPTCATFTPPTCPGASAPASTSVTATELIGGSVWGTGPFTTDSSLPKIARYLGGAEGSTVTLNITDVGCQPSFAAGYANFITTSSYGSWHGMIVTLGGGPSCSTTLPTCNPTGCTLTYSPSSANQSWTKNAGSCGFSCNANYSGPTCSTYTAPIGNSCSSTLPTCQGAGTCTLTYSPTSVNQSWTQNASSCGFSCAANYSGPTCSTYTAPIGNSCSTTLPTCQGAGTCTLTYSPSSVNQSWTQNASSCGYTCNANYSDATCSTYTAPVTYSWVPSGSYGACSVTCGTGTKYAPYVCRNNNTTAIVAGSNCSGIAPTDSQSCTEEGGCLGCTGGSGYWGGGCYATYFAVPHRGVVSVTNTTIGYLGGYTNTCFNGGWPFPPAQSCAYVGSCAGSVGFVPVTAKCTMMWSDTTVGNTATILYQGTFGTQFGTAKCTSPGVWGEYDATMLANCL